MTDKYNRGQIPPLKADVLTLAALFSDRYSFRLPHFQRAYSWSSEQIIRLIADLREAIRKPPERRHHFLGRLLLAHPGTAADTSVIDGHQRLMTLTILFAVLRDIATEDVARAELGAKIVASDRAGSGEPRFRFVPQPNLAPFLARYVQSPGATLVDFEGDLSDLSETEANIIENRDLLRTELRAETSDQRRGLVRLLCDACRVVAVEVEDDDEAWAMIQTEETTRLDFNATDHAKASILSAMTAEERTVGGPIWDHWQARLHSEDMRALLQHVRVLEQRRKSDMPVETEIIKIFQKDGGAIGFFRTKLAPRADNLHRLRKLDIGPGPAAEAAKTSIAWASLIDAHGWVPAALLWLETRGSGDADTPRFLARIERLVWLMRLGGVDPQVQFNRLLRLMREIDAGADPDASVLMIEPNLLSKALSSLRSRSFYSKHYSGRVLRRISALLGADPGPIDGEQISIEHILPKRPGAKQNWRQVFGSRVPDYANRLGNLTFLSPAENQKTGNRDYDEKRPVLAASAFELSRRAAREETWAPKTIEKRTEEMIGVLFAAWELPWPR